MLLWLRTGGRPGRQAGQQPIREAVEPQSLTHYTHYTHLVVHQTWRVSPPNFALTFYIHARSINPSNYLFIIFTDVYVTEVGDGEPKPGKFVLIIANHPCFLMLLRTSIIHLSFMERIGTVTASHWYSTDPSLLMSSYRHKIRYLIFSILLFSRGYIICYCIFCGLAPKILVKVTKWFLGHTYDPKICDVLFWFSGFLFCVLTSKIKRICISWSLGCKD